MLFILRFFFDLVIFIIYVDMCMCESDHKMETSAWCLMEAVSGQTGITVSCIQHIIQVYLKERN